VITTGPKYNTKIPPKIIKNFFDLKKTILFWVCCDRNNKNKQAPSIGQWSL